MPRKKAVPGSKDKKAKQGWTNTPLAGLGEALGKKGATLKALRPEPEPQPPEASSLSDEDIFMEAMQDVKEVPAYRGLKVRPPGSRKPPKRDEDPALEFRRMLKKKGVTLKDTDEYEEWVAKGQKSTLTDALHSGTCSVQDFIDLHGLTEDEAISELVSFIEASRMQGLSCVKVIHGRGLRSPGKPVLKEAVTRLLKGALSKHVRAFSTAAPHDGGLGATYVLMKAR